MRKGKICFLCFKYANIVTYLCFQGEPLGFENKDSFYKELKEEQRSNGAPGEQTEAKGKTHDRARGGTTVL